VDAAERYLVLGTAGHIDHGKTTLIKALTGIDCDTLAEEKDRGITIVLGFAHWQLPDGTHLGIVDVPGHRRFVRSMVAGAAGLDLVMLVVAADDGVMPQTREHLHIARMLGVTAGLVALTKTDLVDDDLRELAIADVEDLIKGTFLDGCPIIPVSATTGAGLEELTQAAMETAAGVSARRGGGQFRLPIDRVFTVKGVGTVVTGTSLAGEVAVDDELELVPGGQRARVRSIELHGESIRRCGAGHRVALNLVGLDKDQIRRGHVLAVPGSLPVTWMLDAEIELLAELAKPVRRGGELMLHIGTAELTAKVFPLEGDYASPGAATLVQLRFGEQLPAVVGDRFILRDSSSEHTIGGGVVLDAHPTKHRRQRRRAAAELERLRGADAVAALLHEAAKSITGLDAATAARRLQLTDDELAAAIEEAQQGDGGLLTHQVGRQTILTVPANRERIVSAAQAALGAHRAENPLVRQGLSARALIKAIDRGGGGVPAEVLGPVLDEAVAAGVLVRVDETYALPHEEIELSARDRRAVEEIERRLNASAQPDQPEEFAAELPVDRKRLRQLLSYLTEHGRIATQAGMYFGEEVVARAKRQLKGHFEREQTLTVSQFGQLLGTTRKYSLPFLQLLEQLGMLRRVGDKRVLSEDWEGGGE